MSDPVEKALDELWGEEGQYIKAEKICNNFDPHTPYYRLRLTTEAIKIAVLLVGSLGVLWVAGRTPNTPSPVIWTDPVSTCEYIISATGITPRLDGSGNQMGCAYVPPVVPSLGFDELEARLSGGGRCGE